MSDSDPCTLLAWDTAFFDLVIARVCRDTLTAIDAREVDAWCHRNAVQCLYFLARSDEPSVWRVAETHGFDLVDIRVTYSLRLAEVVAHRRHSSEVAVRPAAPGDVPTLQGIARCSHTGTRFYADKHFPRHLCDLLYSSWIASSCMGSADMVFVADLGDCPVGYITCHLDAMARQGRIGLFGVGKTAQRQGVGQALMGGALGWFGARQAETVTIVTQGNNVAAQRLYQKNGFLTESLKLWYHKWYGT